MSDNNKVSLVGKITSDPIFSHSVYGIDFYEMDIEVSRFSDNADIIPIIISNKLIESQNKWRESIVEIYGEFRSCNKNDNGKNRLILFVFAYSINVINKLLHINNNNEIFLNGYLCKKPIYRKTPIGRKITDLILCVNRNYEKNDYIPCISWGKNAQFSSELIVGSQIKLYGRIQSRVYRKKLSETLYEMRIAYEVSVYKLEN